MGSDKELKSLDQFNSDKMERYRQFYEDQRKPHYNGIACPKCGAELIDSEPNVTLTSNPPKKTIACPSCNDFYSYRIA